MALQKPNLSLEKNIEALSAINSIIEEIALNVPQSDFVAFVYDKIYSLIEPDLALIFLIEAGKLKLQGDPLRSSTISGDIKRDHQIGECLCGLVAETGEVILSEDIHTDSRCTLEECKAAGVRSLAALPLKIKGELTGVLGIVSVTGCRFSEHANFLQSLAGHIAIGINTAGLYEEIQKKNKLLETELAIQKQTERALRSSEKRYQALADATFEAIFISDKGYCIDANQTAAKMFGYNHAELIGIFGTDVIAPESKETVKRHLLSGYQEPYEVLGMKKDGTRFHVEIRGRMTTYRGRNVRVTVVRNVNERKIAEAALQKAHTGLERKVAERTCELGKVNRQLKVKADNLKEANIALNVLLKKRDNDKKEIEEKALLNVKELVLPYLEKLKNRGLDDRQKTLATILESKRYLRI